jgi:DNA polymerase-3 subunit epsilon
MTVAPILFCDLETTGFLEPEHRIVELTVIKHDAVTEVELSCVTIRIDPQRSIPAKAQKVHGISAADVAGKPIWEAIAPALVKELRGASLGVAHNGDYFDWPFIEMELKRIGLVMPAIKTFDTCKMGRGATPYGKIPSLRELAACLGFEYDESKAHGSEWDTRTLAKCFFEGRRIGFFDMAKAA